MIDTVLRAHLALKRVTGGFRPPADLDPSGPEARQWVQEELANDEYHDGRSLFERVMRWFADQLSGLQDRANDGPGVSLPPFVIAIVAVVLLAGVGFLLTRVRAERRTAQDREAVLGDSDLSVEQFRERGQAALREGRWNDAVVEFTRAIARDGADRTLLSEAPSLTAHEVGDQLADVFPAHASAVTGSMRLFDAVRYGRYAASLADAETVRDTHEALRKARPALPAVHSASEEREATVPVGPWAGGGP